MKLRSLYSACLLAGMSSTVMAAPFMAMDPKSLGMGGTGVASATSQNASFYNPALLAAAQADEDFSLEIPVVSLRVADPDDLQTAVEDFDDNAYFDSYDTAYNNMIATPNATTVAAYDQATKDLVEGLRTLSDKDIEGDAGANVVIGIPSRKTGAAVTIGGWGSAGFRGEFTQSDADTMTNIISEILNDPTNPPASALDPNNLTSNLKVRGIVAQEIGISLARVFNIKGHDLAIGVTPKYVMATTYDVEQSVSDAAVELDAGDKDSTGFTADVGVAKDYGNGWKAGFSIKNLVPQSYETVLGNEIEVNPMARVGASHHTNWTTVALDVDLTENEATSFGNETQYVGLGAELDVWLLQLRLGYRHNIPDDKTSVATAGVGLNVFGLHADVGAAVSPSGHEVGAAAQLGFKF